LTWDVYDGVGMVGAELASLEEGVCKVDVAMFVIERRGKL